VTAEKTDPFARYCGLCNEPKVKIAGGALICPHCDTTVNCPGGRCGACSKVTAKRYPLDDD